MAQMRPVARNITVRPVVPYGVLERKERTTEEKKELIINVYQKRFSMRGIERTIGVSRTNSEFLVKRTGEWPTTPWRDATTGWFQKDSCAGRGWVAVLCLSKTKFGSGLPWMERAEKSSPSPAAIAAEIPPEYFGIAYHLLIEKPSFSVIISARIKSSFRPSNIALGVKKRGKRLILSVGIIPYGNIGTLRT